MGGVDNQKTYREALKPTKPEIIWSWLKENLFYPTYNLYHAAKLALSGKDDVNRQYVREEFSEAARVVFDYLKNKTSKNFSRIGKVLSLLPINIKTVRRLATITPILFLGNDGLSNTMHLKWDGQASDDFQPFSISTLFSTEAGTPEEPIESLSIPTSLALIDPLPNTASNSYNFPTDQAAQACKEDFKACHAHLLDLITLAKTVYKGRDRHSSIDMRCAAFDPNYEHTGLALNSQNPTLRECFYKILNPVPLGTLRLANIEHIRDPSLTQIVLKIITDTETHFEGRPAIENILCFTPNGTRIPQNNQRRGCSLP